MIITTRRKRLTSRASVARLREQRLLSIRRIVDDFLFGIALLMAGHEPAWGGCVAPPLADRLASAFASSPKRTLLLSPDFGTHAELRVEGDLERGETAKATVQFRDQSVLSETSGYVHSTPAHTVRAQMTIHLASCQVERCHFDVID